MEVLLLDQLLQQPYFLLHLVIIEALLGLDGADDVVLHLTDLLPQLREVVLDCFRVRREQTQHFLYLVRHCLAHGFRDVAFHFNDKTLNGLRGIAHS